MAFRRDKKEDEDGNNCNFILLETGENMKHFEQVTQRELRLIDASADSFI